MDQTCVSLMSNHFHFTLEVQRSSTARIVQSFQTSYVKRFNLTEPTTRFICFKVSYARQSSNKVSSF